MFLGNATAPAHIFEVPAGEGTEIYWNVLDLVVNNCENVELRPVNTLSEPCEQYDEYKMKKMKTREKTQMNQVEIMKIQMKTQLTQTKGLDHQKLLRMILQV
ncbi:hypothetical protein MKY07_03190 [Solibacillus sp. FSL W7-1472]|uniref:hypothetical protein n=1 Tax=Solibacillus sp. FSL W7-1472 TaxID=2921707 RepID=UPI0030DC5188